MTLVEKLGRKQGREGDYKWTVEVWRSDANAIANLRVRKKIYREREGILNPSLTEVFSETDSASPETVERKLGDAVEFVKRKSGEFDRESERVTELLNDD